MDYVKGLTFCTAVLLASSAIGVVASPVHARPPVVVMGPAPDQLREHVSYADLNLTLASDQKALNRRVDRAVGTVCQQATDSSDLFANPNCHKYAWDGAKPQITLAIERANQIAQTGSSSIVAAAIVISVPR